MQKVEPLISTFKMKFGEHFKPYKEMAIDEALLKYEGTLGIIQYMSLKPAKRGMKVWMLCTSFIGCVYKFDVYCGEKITFIGLPMV
jgi:hypothetical protein